MISLQNQRVMERFFELAGFPTVVPAQRIEMQKILLEWQENRLLVSLLLMIAPGTEQHLLEDILTFCQPEHTLGIPLRTFALPGILGLAASAPANARAEDVNTLYQQQYQLLQRYRVAINRS